MFYRIGKQDCEFGELYKAETAQSQLKEWPLATWSI